jgi:hypothetical protein
VKKPVAAVIGLCTFLLVAGCGSKGAAHSLSAAMTPRAVVTPQGKRLAVPAALADANAAFSGTVSADNKLSWHISFAKLGNPRLVVADIHSGPPTKFGPVLLRLCGPCKSGANGVRQLEPSVAQRLVTGEQWVTLITDKYPNGAVRGQVVVK